MFQQNRGAGEDKAQQIMNLYRQRPEAGFRLLYATYAGRMQGYLQRMLNVSEQQAEELVHDAFLPWVENPQQMMRIENPAAYLFTSIRHLSQRLLTRERSLPSGETDNDSSEKHFATTDSRLDIETALNLLPEEQKEVLLLRLWKDLTLEEVARIQQVSLQTVSSRYRYALQKLKGVLDHE